MCIQCTIAQTHRGEFLKNLNIRLRALKKVLAFSVLAIVLVGCASTNLPSSERATFVQSQYQLALARNRISVKTYEVAQAKLDSEFRKKFEDVARETSEKLSDKQAIALTVYYLAKDAVARTSEVDHFISHAAGPALGDVVDQYIKELDKLTENLEAELRITSLEFSGAIAVNGSTRDSAQWYGSNVLKSSAEFDKALSDLGYKTAKLGVRVTANIYNFSGRSTLRSLMTGVQALASRIFAKSVTRLIATAAASVFDGPLPISKILTLISVVWTGYELAELQSAYRSALIKSVMEGLESTGIGISASAKDARVQKANSFDELLAEVRAQTR